MKKKGRALTAVLLGLTMVMSLAASEAALETGAW